MTDAPRLKVKRDGPRGWHWIAAASFDPDRHELVDPLPAALDATPEPKRRGRPPKARELTTEKD